MSQAKQRAYSGGSHSGTLGGRGSRQRAWTSRRDLATAKLRCDREGSVEELVIASAYFPGDAEAPPPPDEFKNLVQYCEANHLQLLTGCDGNAHNTAWGSKDDNPRGVALLEYLDLSITVEPVACVKCFGPLEQYYRIKQNTLNSEVVVVNCIKTIVKRSPTRLIKNCEIDLFEEYNDIVELLEKEKERSETSQDETVIQNQSDIDVDKQDLDKTTEEIVIQIESNEPDGKFVAENTKGSNHESVNNCMQNIIEERSAYKVLATSQTGQGTLAIIENMHYTPDSEKKYETVFISSEKS